MYLPAYFCDRAYPFSLLFYTVCVVCVSYMLNPYYPLFKLMLSSAVLQNSEGVDQQWDEEGLAAVSYAVPYTHAPCPMHYAPYILLCLVQYLTIP